MDEKEATRMRRLGRYELLDSLGSGGMGDVHRARAYGAAGTVKELCIKRIRASRLSDAGAVERFVSEARLSMRLSHNNIVPVFDFGRADGQYFLAMEWVDGSDLRSLLRAGSLPACVAAHVAAEVARALEYAHALPESQGGPLIHRDVKPGNILISSAGDVKLVDFGVAVAGPADTEGRVGTLAYMAPEQERGEPVDARADLFALGVVLAEMLGLGRLRCAQELPEETPPAIAATLRRLLAEDRQERPSHAKAVASELEDLVARQRVAGEEAPRDSLRERVAARRVSHSDSVEPEILATDLSYLRDGEERTLGSMLCATGSTAAQGLPDAEDSRALPGDPGTEGRARKLWLIALALGLLSGAAALRFGGARAEPNAPATTRGQDQGQQASATPRSERDAPPAQKTAEAQAPSPVAAPGTEQDPSPRHPVPARRPTIPRPLTHARSPIPMPEADTPANAPAADAPAPAPSRVDINATPWARAFLDGRELGTTPLFDLEVPAGHHLLRLSNPPLGRNRTIQLELEAATHRRVVVDMLRDTSP